MRYRTALVLLASVVAASARAEPVVPPALRALLDAHDDEVMHQAFVPSPSRRVGEVRLIRRGGTGVVQTLLYSKILSRVVAEIRKKEFANWPVGQPGHADAVHYVDALDQVRDAIAGSQPKFERGVDRRQRMLIEFVANDTENGVAIGTFEMEERPGAITVTRRTPLVVLELPRAYVLANMRLIAADSFGVDGPQLGTLLATVPVIGSPAR